MIYFSHRGANKKRVQNTGAAFALAHAQGARCFELDVHLLKDGHLAVHHDYSLLSTAGKDEKLGALSSLDLKKYPLINPFSEEQVFVPLLEEILPIVSPELQLLNIEIKNDNNVYPGIEKAIVKTLAFFPDLLPRILFSSFDYGTLERLRVIWPGAQVGLLTRNFDVNQAIGLGAKSVHINQTRFTSQIAEICHKNRLKMYVYTVNDLAVAAQLQRDGADGIFTDCIDLFLEK